MGHYDRLRGDGIEPADAMREAAPFFDRPSDVRTGQPGPQHRALTAEARDELAYSAAEQLALITDDDLQALQTAQRVTRRGRSIIERLQHDARAAGHDELTSDELRTALATVTDLPDDTITQLTASAKKAAATASTGHNRDKQHTGGTAPARERTAAELAADDFPHSATAAVHTAATNGPTQTPPAPSRTSAPRAPRHHGPQR